jgi:Sec-independent protein translocase protein TatA
MYERPVNEADDLREAAREAHSAMKDMRALMREAEKVMGTLEQRVEELRKAVHNEVDTQIANVVKEGLDEYGKTMDQAIKDGTNAVYRRFDLIYDLLMGKSPSQKRKYEYDLEEVVGIATEGDKDLVRKMLAEHLNADPIKGVVP